MTRELHTDAPTAKARNTEQSYSINRLTTDSYELQATDAKGKITLYHIFGSLNELMEHAETHQITISAADPFAFGYRLGEMAVHLSECDHNQAKVIQGLADSTDVAWAEAVESLAALLMDAREYMEAL